MPLLPVDEALAIVLEATRLLPFEEVPYEEAAGRFLREEVRADQDYPPFDKSLMDGYAILASDLLAPPRPLRVIEEIAAGSDPGRLRPVVPGTAARIMTGAPIPPGADAVLVVEETRAVPGDPRAILATGAARPGDNLARRGQDLRAGALVLSPGEFIGPAEIGVLAALGGTRVRVGGRPRVSVLATGDEIVPAEQTPRPGGIRNSNGPLLLALARSFGAEARSLGIARDDEAALRAAIEQGLRDDVLALSGGVSVGVYDLVAKALRSLGVEIVFDKVAIKPGKPFTFGRRGHTLVFGCPGNPVSTYVIFQVFGRPALRKMAGAPKPSPPCVRGVLDEPVRQRPGRTGYYQAEACWSGDGYRARLLPTSGSGDFVSCARGNALAIIPAEAGRIEAGQAIDLLLLDEHADR